MLTKGEPVLYAASPRKRSPSPLTIILLLVGTLGAIKFIQSLRATPTIPQQQQPYFEPMIQQTVKEAATDKLPQKSVLPIPPALEMEISPACENVDFHWLINDRQFWDGWESKVMFMRTDGKFTRKNVKITEGESVCVVAMTGPIPAAGAIKHVVHYAPADSIILTAQSDTEGVKMPLTLKAHEKERNIYFASARFTHSGVYHLNAKLEYRSYFWEQPSFHAYSPIQFLSKNLLIVDKKTSKPQQGASDSKQEICNIRNNVASNEQTSLESSVWINSRGKKQYDWKTAQKLQSFSMTNSNYTFVPNCKIDQEGANCLLKKTIHMWGDKHLQRNLESLMADTTVSNLNDACNDGNLFEGAAISTVDVNTPFLLNQNSTAVHFGSIDTQIAQSFQQWAGDMIGKARELPLADIVVIGVGNEDLSMARQNPEEFAQSYYAFLFYIANTIYPSQPIIVKTTQYASVKSGASNYGRSLAFANIIKSSVSAVSAVSPNRRNPILVWDTYSLGFSENECRNSLYSTADALTLENMLLTNLVC
ncbi:hypothetical protein BDF20DRAFT_868701 [Mycotypha africana]|uniref:uncharacterized protein n=1 Tax=Mycotypha africana TaxID=64632 RepID=UPI002301D79E|nr:uncharacterized protein BDF20DRAFT_868701 [Mycotypha africana]KAI8979290.1 hypothetical protein BDF20DRAFT_868701 [Mycotypha africana]